MNYQKLPPGWDEARVQRLIAHYDEMNDEEMIAEDEAARDEFGQTVMVVPTELVPRVRGLIAAKQSG
jgi:hypothetical protein